MASLRRKKFTKPMPADAECFTRNGERLARFKQNGRTKIAPVTVGSDGVEKVVIESGVWLGKYRNADGHIIEQSTGCRDKQAAAAILAQWERRSELVKAGVVSKSEDRIADHAATPLSEHLAAYRQCLQAKGTSERHRDDVEEMATRVFRECECKSLSDIDASKVECWLNARQAEGVGARRRNMYLQAVKQFCKWAFESSRMSSQPLARIRKANEKADRRHQRRALSEIELARLFYVARWRPLAEAGRETVSDDPATGKRAGWHYAELRFEDIDEAVERARNRLVKNPKLLSKLDRTGRERELVYRTLAHTGLRRGELAALKLKDVWLDVEPPRFALDASQAKNRTDSQIILRVDLAADIRAWIDQLTDAAAEMNSPLFAIADRHSLLRCFDRDLELAGIPKVDARGHIACVHGLRHSFATSLARAGVAPKVAQTLLRHSDVNLTLSVYSHCEMSDMASSLESLPSYRSTATICEQSNLALPPILPPTGGNSCQFMACIGTEEGQKCEGGVQTKNPENVGVSATFSGSLETSKGGTRTRDSRLMKPVCDTRKTLRNKTVSRSTEGASAIASPRLEKTRRKEAVSQSAQASADFARQVAQIMSLPLSDAERGECIRRLLAQSSKE